MKLHLVRHAKTVMKSLKEKDFDRKLLPKGIVQANVLGHYMKTLDQKIDLTICSDAVRTTETLKIVQHTNDLGKIVMTHDLYLSDRETYLQKLWEQKGDKPILFIGHNEGISEFASYLTEDDIDMKTCEYLIIDFDLDRWKEVSRGTGKIKTRFYPSVCLLDWRE